MKNVFLVLVLVILILGFNSCKKEIENPDDNTDTTGFSSIIPEGWVAEVVDSLDIDISVADFNKIVVDQNNGVHILYSVEAENDYSLKYAYKANGGAWQVAVITGIDDYFDFYYGADIAVTSTDVYVIYVDNVTNSRMHITKKAIGSGTWSDEIFDDNSLARYPNLFVDKNNNVHIGYTHANNGQYYALYGNIGTEISDISSDAGDIVVDKDGVIHIFYSKNYDFRHIYSADGVNWTDEIVYTEPDEYIEHISAAVDTAGNISTGFSMNSLDNNIDFFYKSYGNSDFSFSKTGVVGVSRLQFEVAVDLSGKQYFTTYEYSDNYSLQLSEKNNTASNWSHTLLLNDADLRYGSVSSIIIDKDYGIHISSNGESNEVSNMLFYLYKVHE
ncbi:MAG: hypothetical protein JXL97_02245 [Bacteroidales bacterium]|nr:hypothetical protein [Bacteroidales bacterium]